MSEPFPSVADPDPDQPTFTDFGAHPQEPEWEPSRTSVLSVVSLVLGVLCLPGFGAIGVVLGVVAMVLIARSEGRVVGAGFAAAGIVLGLITTALWVAVLFGVNLFANSMTETTEHTLRAVEQRDVAGVQAEFVADAGSRLTRARIDSFATAVEDQLGIYRQGPDDLLELVTGLKELADVERRMRASIGPSAAGSVTDLPVPVAFEQGRALVFLRLDAAAASGGGFDLSGTIVNLGVGTAGGFEAWMFDPSGQTGGSGSPDPAPSSPPDESDGAAEDDQDNRASEAPSGDEDAADEPGSGG